MKTVSVIFLSTICLLFFAHAWSDSELEGDLSPTITLAVANNFQKDGLIALQKNQSIMVMFGAEYCSFCETLEREILRPMQITQPNSNYLIRKVEIDLDTYVTDFNGSRISMADFSDQHNIFTTPTLVFFDHQGIESAQRIVGVNSVDLLGYYIESSIKLVSNKIAKQVKLTQVTR